MLRLLPPSIRTFENRVPNDRVDHQWVLAWVRDAVRVIFMAEGDGILRPVEEGGRRLLRGEDLVPLSLALAARHVDGRSPEDEEHVPNDGEASGVAISSVLLDLCILRGGAAVELLEHIALLEGVVHRGLVVWTWLF
jgi:hypothetical protein